jgi:formate dehydrogenase subunit beta
LPHCFAKDKIEEVDDLIIGSSRYSLEKIATHISARKPDIKIGMLARDCNQRALNVLYIWNQLNPENVKRSTSTAVLQTSRNTGIAPTWNPKLPGFTNNRWGWTTPSYAGR